MDPIVVFVDDADHARRRLAARKAAAGGPTPAPWRVVLCARPLRRHVARLLPRDQRQGWRETQAAVLRSALSGLWGAEDAAVEWVVADRPCSRLLQEWRRVTPRLQVLDLRRDGFDRLSAPAGTGAPAWRARWAGPLAATAGLSALLVLAD